MPAAVSAPTLRPLVNAARAAATTAPAASTGSRLAASSAPAIVSAAAAPTSGGSPASREQLVAERSADVMPFDLAATTHHFEPMPEGGLQTVVADDPAARRQVELIQQHLRDEAAAFARGEFTDPARIHGSEMPGLATLQAKSDRLDIAFRPRADGAELRYVTDDPVVLAALHDWFAAQASDHQGHAG
jgi:hypothetical protein